MCLILKHDTSGTTLLYGYGRGLQVRDIKAKEGNRVDYKVQGLIFLFS